MKRKKVKSINKANEKIINGIEEITYGSSMFISLIALEINLFDFITDKSFDNIITHPAEWSLAILSPAIIGAIIKSVDPQSETAKEINKMINELKPKARIRKR